MAEKSAFYRSKRLYSANSTRSGSAGLENANLRNTISSLQQELVQRKAETQKVTDQLNCFISLVKRAWAGDATAAIHVANIVGVAPPDYYEDENKVSVTAVPKSRALNNWAVLSIGLLNREYKKIEQIVQAKRRRYLQNRQAYLDEQLLCNRDLQARELPFYCQQPPPSPVESMIDTFNKVSRIGSEGRPPSGKRLSETLVHWPDSSRSRILGRPLYRNSPQTTNTQETDLTWADLTHYSSGSSSIKQKSLNDVFHGLSKLKTADVCHGNSFKKSDTEIACETNKNYADPLKYRIFGLFDPEIVDEPLESNSNTKKRPTSAAKQRSTDAARSRPKSSVLPKSERPMKYETTRPMSAQIVNRRPKSGQTQRLTNGISKDKVFLTLSNDDESESNTTQVPNKASTEISDAQEERPHIDVKIKRPEHVDAFVQDLKTMEKMEEDFRQKLDTLQKKLGISDGLV